MRVRVRVRPGGKTEEVSRLDDGSLSVRVREPARENRANEAVVRAVARHFGVPKSAVRLVAGGKGRLKTLEVPGP